MDKSLFKFIWRYSKRQQIVILAITLLSFPILYMTLELPKWIVNDAIGGKDFPKEIYGLSLDQIPYLIALCLGFLGLVVANNGIKYVLNIYKGVSGERMLRRLRYMLYLQVLRFRLPQFRRVSSSEIIPMMTAEVEDVGVFIGEAIATPAFQGGTLLVYIVFIFAQDPFLGAAAVSLYPIQGYIIPKLQKRVVLLSRERILNVRKISDRIGESIGGSVEIHANDTSRWHLADISERLFVNYNIRLEIYRRKFMIKFINNFMNQLPPFFFYSVGGYLVIKGGLSFGALVAVLAAYKDLAGPWKELLNYYQNLSNVTVKYETVVENFDPEDALPMSLLTADANAVPFPEGDLVASSITVMAGGSGQEVTDVSLTVPQGQAMAVIGTDGSGRTELLLALAGLLSVASGRVELGGVNIDELPEAALGRRRAYVGFDPYVFNDTIRNNVIYAIRNEPQGSSTLDQRELRFRQVEATFTGNSLHEVTAPWEDFRSAGVEHAEALDERLLELFGLVGIGDDLYRLGLKSRLDPDADAALVERVLLARSQIADRIRSDEQLRNLVSLWSIDSFNPSATMAENVLFALPVDSTVKVEQIAHDGDVLEILRAVGLLDDITAMGAEIAQTMVELFAGVEGGTALVGDYSLISSEELPTFESWLRLFNAGNPQTLPAEARAGFIGLAFRMVPARHRLIELAPERIARIVEARPQVQQRLMALDGRFVAFAPDTYIPPLTIEDNILFGKARVDRRDASERIDGFIRATVAELGLRDPIAHAGFSFEAGVAGSRLSGRQRRRIALVRALIKRPSIVIIDSVFDDDPQLVPDLRRAVAGSTIVVGTASAAIARQFDSVAAMRDSRLVAAGTWDSVAHELGIDPQDAQVREADDVMQVEEASA